MDNTNMTMMRSEMECSFAILLSSIIMSSRSTNQTQVHIPQSGSQHWHDLQSFDLLHQHHQTRQLYGVRSAFPMYNNNICMKCMNNSNSLGYKWSSGLAFTHCTGHAEVTATVDIAYLHMQHKWLALILQSYIWAYACITVKSTWVHAHNADVAVICLSYSPDQSCEGNV